VGGRTVGRRGVSPEPVRDRPERRGSWSPRSFGTQADRAASPVPARTGRVGGGRRGGERCDGEAVRGGAQHGDQVAQALLRGRDGGPGRPEAIGSTPVLFPPLELAEVKALACQLPAATGVPLSRWSCKELAAELVTRAVVAAISASTVWRTLRADAIRPWFHRMWISPGTRTSPPRQPERWTCTPGSSRGRRSARTST
jgi:hypothetical protein